MSLIAPSVYYPASWPATDPAALDVAILGGGQSGLAIWHGLRLAGIGNVAIFDAAPPGRQGVWQSVARMRTLRTDKTISGPEHGNPDLSFARWLDRSQGEGAFDAVGRIPRLLWQAYLDWFAAQTGAEPRWEHRLTGVSPGPSGLVLRIATPDGPERIAARHLVVATGMDGFGAAYIPEDVRAAVPPDRLWHSQDDIPDRVFAGQRILVIGGSASAFDVAATALERGAAQVHQIARNPDLALPPPMPDLRDLVAAQRGFFYLSDRERWERILRQRARGTVPPQSVDRARSLPGYQLHNGRPPAGLRAKAQGMALELDGRTEEFDQVIAATGNRQGAHLRAEFAALAPLIRQWGGADLPCTPEQAPWRHLPYLGEGFELLALRPEADWVSRIHVFTYAAILSHGMHVGDIASAAVTVPRLTAHLARRLAGAARPPREAGVRGTGTRLPEISV